MIGLYPCRLHNWWTIRSKDGKGTSIHSAVFLFGYVGVAWPVAEDEDVMRFTATEIAARQRDRLSILDLL